MRITRAIRRWNAFTPERRTVVVAGTAGLVVAGIGVLSGGITFGAGYEEARAAVEGTPTPPAFFLAKFVVNLASTVSGIPGGLFAPSLSVGAGLGSTIGQVLGSDIGLAAVLGMAGYFAGVVQAPMTAFVIVMEMTGNQSSLIALMTSSVIGYGVSRIIAPQPLYHALARLFIADVLRRRRAEGQTPGPVQTSAHSETA